MEAYSADRSLKGKLRRRLALLSQRRPVRMKLERPMVTFSFDDAPASAADAGARTLELRGIRGTWYFSAGLAGQDGPEPQGIERPRRLLEMDASSLKFADDTFDIVYAPYVISVVPDPIAVTREMCRVCRPGGRIVILNHFRSKSRLGAWLEKIIAPFTLYLGFKSDLDLPAFLVQANLKPVSIEKVNVPRIWSLVTCIKI